MVKISMLLEVYICGLLSILFFIFLTGIPVLKSELKLRCHILISIVDFVHNTSCLCFMTLMSKFIDHR